MRFIIDRNLFPPVFNPTTETININEDQSIGAVIGRCTATDNDSTLQPNTNANNYRYWKFILYIIPHFVPKRKKNDIKLL